MAKYYKLNEEIKQFIIQQKKADPELSCRNLVPLVKEHFQISLSKSLINNDIIWQEGLSHAANRINESKIFTADGEQIWPSPQAQFL